MKKQKNVYGLNNIYNNLPMKIHGKHLCTVYNCTIPGNFCHGGKHNKGF